MPEHGSQERALPGGVIEGPSTDASIQEIIDALKGQIAGTTGNVIDMATVQSQDVLSPRADIAAGGSDASEIPGNVTLLSGRTPTDSVTGLGIRELREGKKAA